VGTALAHLTLLRGLLCNGETAQEVEKELNRLEDSVKGISEIPIVAPLSHEDAVDCVKINDLLESHLKRRWKHVRYAPVALQLDPQVNLDNVATLRASREWLRRALEILVDNSVQNMLIEDSPEKKLTVATRLVGETVEISVKDTGPGIPEDVLDRLFKKPIDKPMGSKGAGIGLILARTIVQTYDGDLFVKSTGDEVTTMVIVLPVEVQQGVH
jgi:signal transduction histidine kinase